jgi:hypothetical protein
MTNKSRKFIGELVGFILFMLFLLFVSTRGNAQTRSPFDPISKQRPAARFRAPIVGRAASNYMLRHGKLGHLCGRFTVTDLSIWDSGHVMVMSPALAQGLKWRKK